MLSHSVVSDSATLWTVARQAPLSMGFSRQGHEWVAVPSSRGSSQPRDRTCISFTSCTGRRVLCQQSPPGSAQMPPAPPCHTAHSHTLITLTCYHTHLVTRTVGAHSLPHLCFPLDTPCVRVLPCRPQCTHTHTHTHSYMHTYLAAHSPSDPHAYVPRAIRVTHTMLASVSRPPTHPPMSPQPRVQISTSTLVPEFMPAHL